jgi:hypothetical protein
MSNKIAFLVTFLTAFFRIGLLVAQMNFIASKNYSMIVPCSVAISICWIINVTNVTKSIYLKIAYVMGAGIGTLVFQRLCAG